MMETFLTLIDAGKIEHHLQDFYKGKRDSGTLYKWSIRSDITDQDLYDAAYAQTLSVLEITETRMSRPDLQRKADIMARELAVKNVFMYVTRRLVPNAIDRGKSTNHITFILLSRRAKYEISLLMKEALREEVQAKLVKKQQA